MGCTNITPLVLSDTFNTWFERTNECIEGLNTLSLRGLSATNTSGTDIEGFVIQEDNNCFYTVNLRTGPFVGFVGASDGGYSAGIHGTGSYEDPYNLTLKFTGTETELERAQVATADYLLVSDTSDNQLFKKTPATAFITNLKQGNNIKITEDPNDGSFTIGYNESSFAITTSVNNDLTSKLEVGKTFNTNVLFTAEATPQSTAGLTSCTVRAPTNKVSNFGTKSLTVDNSGEASGTFNVNIPSQDWYSVNDTSVVFTFGGTSDSVDKNGNPIEPLYDEESRTKVYGLQFVLFAGNYENTNQIQSAFGNFYTGVSGVASDLITTPKTRRSYTWTFSGGGNQFYWFAHTEKSSSTNYGFNPNFYPDNGSIVESNFDSFGFITYDGRTYEIFRSPSAYPSGGVFGVGE